MSAVIAIDRDVLWPLEPAYRFGVYGLKGGRLDLLAAAPDAAGAGLALDALDLDCRAAGHRDGIAAYGAIGVRDRIGNRWLTNPFRPRGAS